MSNPATAVATLDPAKDAVEAQERLLKLEDSLNVEFIERRQPIRTLVNALVSERHHFQLGSPGVAKSALVERLYLRIGGLEEGDFFRWLLTKFTDPGELFGPMSISAMKNDEYKRVTKGKLPEARIAFADEIFKANSAILNSLLTIMNERLFFNGSEAISVNLSTVCSASNEMPAGEELAALYDRLHFRHIIKPVSSSSSFIKMLRLEWDPTPEPVIHIHDISLAQQAARLVEMPVEVFDAMRVLRDDLRKEGIEPTDRRFRESIPIIKATAFLGGRDIAEIEDMSLLQHVLWDRPENQALVNRCVMALANPLDKEAQDLLDDVNVIAADIDKVIQAGDSTQAIARQSTDFFAKLKKIKEEIEELTTKFKTAKRKSVILSDLKHTYAETATTLQEKCFNVKAMASLSKLEGDDDE